MKEPKVCIVHDYLAYHGGAERTLEAMCEVFPHAPIYTGIYKPKNMGSFFKSKKIISAGKVSDKLFSAIPIFSKFFTFLFPLVFENLDLSEYDIIISSSSSYAKGVITKPSQLHISYIHTPPRFLYGYSVESTKRVAWYFKPFVNVIDHFLRIWDYTAAQRADFIIANSLEVKKRISKFYKRNSTIINPPVEINYSNKNISQNNLEKPYYLALGRLSHYKNFGLLIEAFTIMGKPLKIIGAGKEEKKLKKMGGDNIEFLGRVDDIKKHKIIQGALGVLFPVVEEDFGIVPIEAMGHGIPVLAHRSGGPKETIRENKDGLFFDSLDLEKFINKFNEFDQKIHNGFFNSEIIKEHSEKFSKERFKKEFEDFVIKNWNKMNSN